MLCTHKTTILCQFGLSCHQLTTISPSTLNHFWWELYQFRFHMIDHYIRSCHIIMHNTRETWGLIYSHPMRKIANQNMLKRILIAMHNENNANCNENFRICAEEPIGPLYKWLASIGLWGWRYSNYKFSSGPFWTHKIKTKAKYISISNILHLLSAPASIPRVEAVLPSLVVVSPSNCKFSSVSDFSFDC